MPKSKIFRNQGGLKESLLSKTPERQDAQNQNKLVTDYKKFFLQPHELHVNQKRSLPVHQGSKQAKRSNEPQLDLTSKIFEEQFGVESSKKQR